MFLDRNRKALHCPELPTAVYRQAGSSKPGKPQRNARRSVTHNKRHGSGGIFRRGKTPMGSKPRYKVLKVRVKFSLEQATKAQRGSICVALLFLNPLNAELNPPRHLLALVGARHIVYVSTIRVKPRR